MCLLLLLCAPRSYRRTTKALLLPLLLSRPSQPLVSQFPVPLLLRRTPTARLRSKRS